MIVVYIGHHLPEEAKINTCLVVKIEGRVIFKWLMDPELKWSLQLPCS